MILSRRSRTALPVTGLCVLTTLTLGLGTAAADGSTTAPGVPPSLAAADPTIAHPASDPFYTPPTTIPATPGTLIRSQFAPHLLHGVDTGDAPARADRILYTSTATDGSPVATSGFVMEPTVPWTGAGPTPTIVFAPGTRGSGDVCAPSRAGNLVLGADMSSGNVNLSYEYPFYAMASAAGYRVVVTDYIGLGTPGQHTYVNHTEEGHAVLDAARAGLRFAGAPADSPVALFGYSQGGGASAGAAELAASYAPELNLTGAFIGAPPANLQDVTDTVDGSTGGTVLGFALNGAIARNPELASLADDYFNEEGKQFLADTKDACTVTVDTDALGDTGSPGDPGSAFGSLGDAGSAGGSSGDPLAAMRFDSRELTTDGRSFGEIVRSDERLRGVLLGPDYRLGDRAPEVPVFVLGGVNDDTIPYGQTRQLAADYCAAGTSVTFVTDETPAILPGLGLGHAVPQAAHAGEALGWLGDRFTGKDAPDDCGTFRTDRP